MKSNSPEEDKINVIKDPEVDYEAGKDSFKEWHNKLEADRIQKEKKFAEDLKKRGVKLTIKCSLCGSENKGDEIVLPENGIRWELCSDCLMEQKKKEDLKTKRLRSDFFDSIIPPRYLSKGLKPSKNEKILKSDCSILFGGFGTGKTWEAYSVSKRLYIDGSIESFKVITEIGLVNEIKSGFKDNSFDKKLKELKTVDFLTVDEVGKSTDSEFDKSQLFEILNYRYDWMKKTMLICNASEVEELKKILSPAILDRYRECIIQMGGASKRYLEDNKGNYDYS